MKQRVEEMEKEAKKLRELQAAAEQASNTSGGEDGVPMETEEDKMVADGKSIYVGNVRHIMRLSMTHLALTPFTFC